MMDMRRILRDYRDAGSVNGLLALWGFVDDTTFLTKAGHVGVVYRLRGVDFERLSHPQRQSLVHRFEAGLRLLDEHCRVYQFLSKRTVGPFVSAPCDAPIANEAIQRSAAYLNGRRQDLYDLSLHLVLLYEAPHVIRRSTELRRLWHAPRAALRAWLSTDQTFQMLESELDRAIGTLRHKAQAFEVQIGEFGPTRLQKADAFRFFRELVNYSPDVVDSARLAYDTHLDYFVSDSAIDCHRDHLFVGDRIVKVLSMKEPPSQTYAFLLQDLYEIPGEFIACLEWQRIPSDRMRREVQSRRRHFFNKRVSIVNYVSPDTRPEEMLVDDSASTTVRQLGDAPCSSGCSAWRCRPASCTTSRTSRCCRRTTCESDSSSPNSTEPYWRTCRRACSRWSRSRTSPAGGSTARSCRCSGGRSISAWGRSGSTPARRRTGRAGSST